jgi:hypothetical protein
LAGRSGLDLCSLQCPRRARRPPAQGCMVAADSTAAAAAAASESNTCAPPTYITTCGEAGRRRIPDSPHGQRGCHGDCDAAHAASALSSRDGDGSSTGRPAGGRGTSDGSLRDAAQAELSSNLAPHRPQFRAKGVWAGRECVCVVLYSARAELVFFWRGRWPAQDLVAAVGRRARAGPGAHAVDWPRWHSNRVLGRETVVCKAGLEARLGGRDTRRLLGTHVRPPRWRTSAAWNCKSAYCAPPVCVFPGRKCTAPC